MCYTTQVQNAFSIGGFLYNKATQQILLQQEDDLSGWSLICGYGKSGEDPKIAFQKIIQEVLDIKIKPSQIYPVYDYPDKITQIVNYVYYVEVEKAPKLTKINMGNLAWKTFAETLKLIFSLNAKQDIVVGGRVIAHKSRLDQGLQNQP